MQQALDLMGQFDQDGGIRDIEATIQAIRDELVKGMGETDVREKLMGLGVEPDGRAPAEFAKFHQADIARWTAIAKAAKLKFD